MALLAASAEAISDGYRCLILSSRTEGEAREVAKVSAAIATEVRGSGTPLSTPAGILAGGETIVTIRGCGKGGRNQELALSAAIALDGWDGIALLSAGTDGTDGPTDTAGAFISGATCQKARDLGMAPSDHLSRNDSQLLQRNGRLAHYRTHPHQCHGPHLHADRLMKIGCTKSISCRRRHAPKSYHPEENHEA